MTVNQMIKILNEIPLRDRDREVSVLCSPVLSDASYCIGKFEFSWGDFSDGMLLFIIESPRD